MRKVPEPSWRRTRATEVFRFPVAAVMASFEALGLVGMIVRLGVGESVLADNRKLLGLLGGVLVLGPGIDAQLREHLSAQGVLRQHTETVLITVQIYWSLGRENKSLEAARRGVERARRALALNPADARALYLGATGLETLDQREEATEWAERALAIDPDEPTVLYNIACLYSTMRRPDDAMDLLERAVLPGMANRSWVKHDSSLDPLRDQPRFKAFLKTLS